jgi:hypothetical protein
MMMISIRLTNVLMARHRRTLRLLIRKEPRQMGEKAMRFRQWQRRKRKKKI